MLNHHRQRFTSIKHQQVAPIQSCLQMISAMHPQVIHSDHSSKSVLPSQHHSHPAPSGSSRRSESASPAPMPCINATITKTIPLPQYHVPRTQSEVQLQDDTLAAEFRDFCMFRRLVEGMHKRCTDGKQQHLTPIQDDASPPFRKAHSRNKVPMSRAAQETASNNFMSSTLETDTAAADDYGHFVIDDQDVLAQEFPRTTSDNEPYASHKSFAFPHLPDADVSSGSGNRNTKIQKNVPATRIDVPERGVHRQESSFDEDDVDDSIFVLDL
jgi:hypothetical protein